MMEHSGHPQAEIADQTHGAPLATERCDKKPLMWGRGVIRYFGLLHIR